MLCIYSLVVLWPVKTLLLDRTSHSSSKGERKRRCSSTTATCLRHRCSTTRVQVQWAMLHNNISYRIMAIMHLQCHHRQFSTRPQLYQRPIAVSDSKFKLKWCRKVVLWANYRESSNRLQTQRSRFSKQSQSRKRWSSEKRSQSKDRINCTTW